ncbi:gliding motility-associated C-terminal domain-containing protein [Myroides sp. M-43]|uniref:gliding motility-associated C-terminal domain-containing protein n=1 Tax=Myroides oncorhynchi TaxID=2893756 RepID=UPI001E2A9387|nr:gliding motility-associated C-terminal domain-containing protein [Myroides oncorhynchi]MCC9041282.1 gliding motility-associated C-terminal domain-containing protein [Myroides oncorhynchi]
MKKENALKLVLFSGGLIWSTLSNAQEKLNLYNSGSIFVESKEVLSVQGQFENAKGASFTNLGEVHFLDDFNNEGDFVFSKTERGSKVFFSQLEGTKIKKKISGGANSTEFDNVFFDTEGIDLQNEISISGRANFERGNVIVNTPLSGSITFTEGSSIGSVGDSSHVVGMADREGKSELTMPIGDGTYYRPITLGDSKGTKDLFQSEYKRSNPLVGRTHTKKNAIVEINNAEYWEVKNEVKDGGAIILTLSWNEKTTPASLLVNPEKGLHILRWDAKELVWVDEGGIVDVTSKTVRTPMTVNASGIFTLGIVDVDYNAEIKIYNAVSPNGDGLNDYFIIENIGKYPNTVEIFNRWSSKVYSTTNYDPNGDGSTNVFKGEAEGKGVSSSGKLATGTYYYIVRYEVRTANGSEWIKRSGYLHLENN